MLEINVLKFCKPFCMFDFIPVACKAEGIQRMGTETVDTSKKDLKIIIVSFSLCSSAVVLMSSVAISSWAGLVPVQCSGSAEEYWDCWGLVQVQAALGRWGQAQASAGCPGWGARVVAPEGQKDLPLEGSGSPPAGWAAPQESAVAEWTEGTRKRPGDGKHISVYDFFWQFHRKSTA